MSALVKVSGGLVFSVSKPNYGKQDYGITPQGPLDWLSFLIAHILIGEPADFCGYEIISAPTEFILQQDVILVITGAEYANYYCYSVTGSVLQLRHNTVYEIKAGSRIIMNGKRIGFRTYLLLTNVNIESKQYIGLQRDNFFYSTLSGYSNVLDVVTGPEFDYLVNPAQVLDTPWQISHLSDTMGVRLNGSSYQLTKYDILSSAVCDGTIQFTKEQPIILLTNRQTIGGYPRIFVMTRLSLCHLAQTPFNKIIRFQLIDLVVAEQRLQVTYQMLAMARSAIQRKILANK